MTRRDRRVRGLVLIVSGLLAMAACTIEPPQPFGTVGETSGPKPLPTLASYDQPSQFDLTKAVHLEPVDGITEGLLDGPVFYAVDYTGTIWGIDVSTGDTVLNAWFPGYDTGGANPWSCFQLVTDQSRVFTIGADYDEDPGMPVAVRLVAVGKADSTVLWDYSPPTTALPTLTECAASSVHYAITVTQAGLLLTMQQLTDGVWTPTSTMLDPATGEVVWTLNAAVSTTGGMSFGIAVTAVPESGGELLQVSPVNLATGRIGAALIGESPDAQTMTATGFTLAGQAGGNLVVLAQTTPADSPGLDDTTILQVAGSTGALVPGTTVKASSTDLNACRLALEDTLVCTSLSEPARAVGVSVPDGQTLWQHIFSAPSPEPSMPLLFGGYLYGSDETGASFVLDTASGQVIGSGQYPQPIAVNGSGIVYTVPHAAAISGWHCLWAPAIG